MESTDPSANPSIELNKGGNESAMRFQNTIRWIDVGSIDHTLRYDTAEVYYRRENERAKCRVQKDEVDESR